MRCWILGLGVTLLTSSCTQPGLCTTEAVAGIQVTLKDSLSKNPICDATVTLTEGSHVETATAQPGNPCTYAGAWERPGSYTVGVSHSLHHPATKGPVVVDQDSCHVVTQLVALELSPL